MTRRPRLVLALALLAAGAPLVGDTTPLRAAEPSWSASAANRCTIRTLLLGPGGRTQSLPDQIGWLAAMADRMAGEDPSFHSPTEAADLLGIRAASRARADASFALSGSIDPRARAALAGLVAEAALDLARVAPQGSLPDEAAGRLAVALARTGRIDAALAALDQIPDPEARKRSTERIAEMLHATGAAADAQRFYDRIPDAAQDPFVDGLVPNLLAVGRSEDALAIALGGDVRLVGRHELPIAEHHLLNGDAAAARRVYGLLRDGLQQPGANWGRQALGGLTVGLTILGDSAEAERLRTTAATDEDRRRLARDELATAVRIAVVAQARGLADLARRGLAIAQQAMAAGPTLDDDPAELAAFVELAGLLDGAAAAARLVESVAPRERARLAVLWAREGDLARAIAALSDMPDFTDAADFALAAARARLAADDADGAMALLERLEPFHRPSAVGNLLVMLARAGRIDRIGPLADRLPDAMQRAAAYRGALTAAFFTGDRAAGESLLGVVPPDLMTPVATELLQVGRAIPAEVRLQLIDGLLKAAIADPVLIEDTPGLMIDRARLLAARGDRDDAALELQFARDSLGFAAPSPTRLKHQLALVAASVDLGRKELGALLADTRALIEAVPPGPFERGFGSDADKVGDRAVVMRRQLQLAELLAEAGEVAEARALIEPIRAFHDTAASPEERAHLGPSLARSLIVAGPPEAALGFRFETALGSQLEPVWGLVIEALARANPRLLEIALEHLSARLAQMDPAAATDAAMTILGGLFGPAPDDPSVETACDLPRDRGIADLATAGATAAAGAALEACLAQPAPACVTALALPSATAADRDARVWVLGESLARLLDRNRRPVVLASIGLLADGLDAKGRRLATPRAAAPAFDPRPEGLRLDALRAPSMEEEAKPIALDEARFQLVRLWSQLGDVGRALDIVPRIERAEVRLQAILKVAVALHRAGDVEAAGDLLWLAREIAGPAPSTLWVRIAVAQAEIGDLAGALRLAQQSARQGGGLFDPQKLLTPVLDIASARLRAGDGTAVMARLAVLPEGSSRDLAHARLAIRAAGLGRDEVVAAAAARVANPTWRRQSLAASAEAQLRDGRIEAAARSAAGADDAALGARVAALQRAVEAAAGRREAQTALDGIAEPALRFEARARLALALAATPRRAGLAAAAQAALEAAAGLPPAEERASLLGRLAEALAPHDRAAAQAAFAAALRATIALEAPDPSTLWNARIEPLAAMLAAAVAVAP